MGAKKIPEWFPKVGEVLRLDIDIEKNGSFSKQIFASVSGLVAQDKSDGSLDHIDIHFNVGQLVLRFWQHNWSFEVCSAGHRFSAHEFLEVTHNDSFLGGVWVYDAKNRKINPATKWRLEVGGKVKRRKLA